MSNDITKKFDIFNQIEELNEDSEEDEELEEIPKVIECCISKGCLLKMKK